MGRKVGKKINFKKKFCPIFYFMTHLFPTAQLKNRGVEAQGHNFFNIIFYLYVLLNQIRDNHIFTKYLQNNFFFLGHKIYWVGSFLSGRSGYRKQ